MTYAYGPENHFLFSYQERFYGIWTTPPPSLSHHTHIRYVVEEGAEWWDRMIADVLKLHNQVVTQLLIDYSHWDRTGFVLKEVAIVCGL